MDYLKKAENLKNQNLNLEDLILAIREYLVSHFDNLGKSYQAKSILESRFTPSEIAFNVGMNSCGSKTNIATDMLRHIGYEVKKIHGSIPDSPDHAWVKVEDPVDNIWKSFDITKSDCKVTSGHKIIAEAYDWADIKDSIQKALVSGS